MKYILLTILTLLSDCMQMSNTSNGYDDLWEKVEKFESKQLPKSANEVVMEIYEKAIIENRSDHLIKALLYTSKLGSQFEDRDPASYIEYFEEQIDKIRDDDGIRLCYSIIGELYQQYGMMNMSRFGKRTDYDENDNSEISGLSLEEIQERSIDYYDRSLKGASNTKIDQFKILLTDSKSLNTVMANNISEFLSFRALSHYINDQSFISLAGHNTTLADPALFSSLDLFKTLDISASDKRNYPWKALKLFQHALNESKEDVQKRMINLERIEYVYNKSSLQNKQELYINALKKLIDQDPDSKAGQLAHGKVIEYYLRQGEFYRASFDKKYEDNFTKAYQWIQRAKKRYPKGEHSDIIANQQLKLNKRFCRIETEQVVPSNKDFLSYIQYRNVDHVIFRLVKLDDRQWEDFNNNKDANAKIMYLKKLESIRKWEIDLPGTEDFNYHGTEIPVEGLSYGRYILMVSNTKDFEYGQNKIVNLAVFHVSDLSYIHNSRSPVTELFVIDRITGKAVKDAKVEVFAQEYNYQLRKNQWHKISTLKSDKEGYVSYDKKGRNFSFRIIHKDDILDLRQGHYNQEERESKERSQIHLFTDRAIYRPGQTIFFKGLLTSTSRDGIPKILPNEEVLLDFRDANWQIVESRKLETNDYGTISGHFIAPQGVLTGQLTIEARSSNGFSSHSVKLEEYKRPSIFAKFDTLKSAYVLGDTININGFVESFSSLKVENATIKYRVERIEYIPWYRYRYADFSRPVLNQNNEFIGSGEIKSDIKGEFTFKFPTVSDGKKHAYFNYRIHCDITDITGESTSINKQISLSTNPFFFNASIPANVFEGEVGPVNISTTNCEGAKIDARVNLKVFKLAHPQSPVRPKYWNKTDRFSLSEKDYKTRFPLDAVANRVDPVNWKVLEMVQEGWFDSNKDKVKFLDDLKRGAYKLVFQIKDEKGNSKEEESFLMISDIKNKALPVEHLWHSTVKDSYEPGEKFKLKINAPYEKFRLFYRISKGANNLSSEWKDQKSRNIEYEINESHRGGLGLQLILVINNRVYSRNLKINVPWTNKFLDIEYSTFRDKIKPGSDEEWKIILSTKKGAFKGEILASMYDASLDQFVNHSWNRNFYPTNYNRINWSAVGFKLGSVMNFYKSQAYRYNINVDGFGPALNWFGFYLPYRGGHPEDIRIMASTRGTPMNKSMTESSLEFDDEQEMEAPQTQEPTHDSEKADSFQPRENLNETVFFYPEIHTDDGNSTIGFTMNEALTKWKFNLFAHTKDLEYIFDQKEVITQKELMIEPHIPRFVRQGDIIELTAKVSNLTDKDVSVNTGIDILDAMNGNILDDQLLKSIGTRTQDILLKSGESKVVEWTLNIPQDLFNPLKLTCWVKSDKHTDGEVNILPVLSNRMLVTEAFPFHVNAEETSIFEFDALQKMDRSSSLINHRYSIELTRNPNWIVLKSLPYLFDRKVESTNSIVDAYFGSALASDLVGSNEDIKEVLRQWSKTNMESSLRLNEDLKLSDLDQTPWVRDAIAEEKNMRELALYLDENHVNSQLNKLERLLIQRQQSNGGFSWYPGGRDNWYITQYVLECLGKLKELDLMKNEKLKSLVKSSVKYIDNRILEHFKRIDKEKYEYTDSNILHYYYVRSLFREIPVANHVYPAFNFFQGKLKDNWAPYNSYQQALLSIAFQRWNELNKSDDIYRSLNEKMIQDEELGNYWNDQAGYYWYNSDISKQSAMIELFRLKKAEQSIIDGLKLWLLRNKQVNSWNTSRETSAAVYAFMIDSENWLSFDGEVNILLPSRAKQIEFSNPEFATGYGREDYDSGIDKGLSKLQVSNRSQQLCWGAAYWQYFEDLDKIQGFQDNPLSISKQIFKLGIDDNGLTMEEIGEGSNLKPGDRVRIRIELITDRPVEFIEMKDMRSSGLEPTDVLSQYKYQDGLGYYQSTKDVATHFYFDRLAKGRYVFEYDLIASHAGQFSNGICQIQSYYAPEFGSHSQGISLEIN